MEEKNCRVFISNGLQKMYQDDNNVFREEKLPPPYFYHNITQYLVFLKMFRKLRLGGNLICIFKGPASALL